MQRTSLLLLTVILLVSTAVPIAGQAPQRVQLEPNEITFVGVCNFDVQYTEVRVHANDLAFVEADGELTREIVAGNVVTRLTNANTGASVTLNSSGQLFFTPNPDGSLAAPAHGRHLLVTTGPEPFFIFHRGFGDSTYIPTAESFEFVVNELRGSGFDVCDVLGA